MRGVRPNTPILTPMRFRGDDKLAIDSVWSDTSLGMRGNPPSIPDEDNRGAALRYAPLLSGGGA